MNILEEGRKAGLKMKLSASEEAEMLAGDLSDGIKERLCKVGLNRHPLLPVILSKIWAYQRGCHMKGGGALPFTAGLNTLIGNENLKRKHVPKQKKEVGRILNMLKGVGAITSFVTGKVAGDAVMPEYIIALPSPSGMDDAGQGHLPA